jgi:hypothetical protein
MNSKKILYIDMDNVLVDFASGIARLIHPLRKPHFGFFEHFADGENPIPVFLRLSQAEKSSFRFFRAFRGWRKAHFGFFTPFADGENLILFFSGISRAEKTLFRFFGAFRGRRKSHFVFLRLSQAATTSCI